jgi:hypothetical protein
VTVWVRARGALSGVAARNADSPRRDAGESRGNA